MTKRETQRSVAKMQQSLDLHTDASGSRVQATHTHFSEEEKEAGCPNVPWAGWTDLKLLRTGTHGEVKAD